MNKGIIVVSVWGKNIKGLNCHKFNHGEIMFKFIQILFFFLLAYLAVKLVQHLLKLPPNKTEIKGSPKDKKPLDLSDADIEDADFKEIDDG